eukprot:CAMPEP_0202082970 /NCGR_PEP_ID=MMETSP0964-20121228/21792_1 /ASSEMBLY_ACC=CAM_ASM_000500 /TAXON_ID=4773 /ORGANISM="Schizochytrium aggregatum, Strain ATCC28209" /LENGTH=288 /DNA_ID=CAMNT_0048650647 /DNA_START=72 /DNA_END=939 /DNA_ORIENTATION=-
MFLREGAYRNIFSFSRCLVAFALLVLVAAVLGRLLFQSCDDAMCVVPHVALLVAAAGLPFRVENTSRPVEGSERKSTHEGTAALHTAQLAFEALVVHVSSLPFLSLPFLLAKVHLASIHGRGHDAVDVDGRARASGWPANNDTHATWRRQAAAQDKPAGRPRTRGDGRTDGPADGRTDGRTEGADARRRRHCAGVAVAASAPARRYLCEPAGGRGRRSPALAGGRRPTRGGSQETRLSLPPPSAIQQLGPAGDGRAHRAAGGGDASLAHLGVARVRRMTGRARPSFTA